MLTRIPWWGWMIVILTTLYAIYNPTGYSLFHMWTDHWEAMLSVKVLVTAAVATVVGIIVTATWKSIGLLGTMVIVALLAFILWVVADLGFGPAILAGADWLTQPVAAVVLTIGLRWARLYRAITGRAQVDEVDVDTTSAHH